MSSTLRHEIALMPISEEARRLAEQRAQGERARARRAIDKIRAAYGVTYTELSVAMGVHAPDVGQTGRALASAWRAGIRTPDAYHLAVLEMLAEGDLELEHIGAEGRRKLYKVVPAEHARAA